MNNPFRARASSRGRAAVALLLAAGLDALQLAMGPLGWTFADEVLDIIGLGVFSVVLGFHPLFLPTFIIEIIPIADMLPTWTACVGAVLVLRRKSKPEEAAIATTQSPTAAPSKPAGPQGPIVDV